MKDSNVTMEIPVHTTIAFGITELEIKHDGCFGENFKISVYFDKNSLLHLMSCAAHRAVPDVRH